MHKYDLNAKRIKFSYFKSNVGYIIALLVHHLFSEHIKLQMNTRI